MHHYIKKRYFQGAVIFILPRLIWLQLNEMVRQSLIIFIVFSFGLSLVIVAVFHLSIAQSPALPIAKF